VRTVNAVANITFNISSKVWVFDLDDTLHDASAHIFPVMNQAMTQYIMDHLNLDEHDAHALRRHYWHIYGATMKGLTRHHGIKAGHFLNETHQFPELAQMVVHRKRLRHWLQQLVGRKVVFTNAPQQYAMRVLTLLGIADLFEEVFSVESSRFHPKPSVRGFTQMLQTIKAKASDCVMLEDSLPALMTAKRLGMKTIWVSRRLYKPNYVNLRIPSVLALTHVRL
jgi:putative hydrolase of the HAD superfamily